MSKKTGVIVGRFQVNDLHTGHLSLINQVLAHHSRVILFLGVTATGPTKRNPLDFETREHLIHQYYPTLEVYPLKDEEYDATWSSSLDKAIQTLVIPDDVVLYGSRDSFIKVYSGQYTTVLVEAQKSLSGSELREHIKKNTLTTEDFRTGVIYGLQNQYDKVYPTVDVAILNGNQLLLGRKPHQTLFRFPGGFTDPADESYEMAAQREALEETGLHLEQIQYLGSHKINDWRYQSETDKIISLFFKAQTSEPHRAKANDDLAELKWVQLDTLDPLTLVPEHRYFLKLLQGQN